MELCLNSGHVLTLLSSHDVILIQCGEVNILPLIHFADEEINTLFPCNHLNVDVAFFVSLLSGC